MVQEKCPVVRSNLRTLERKLVFERAEQRVSFLVEQLVQKWDWAAYQGKATPDQQAQLKAAVQGPPP